MNFSFYLKLYLLTLPLFLLIDMIWLVGIAKNFYNKEIGHLMADQANKTAAVIFYAMFIIGIIFFAVRPAIAADSWQIALLYGGLFGFFTYATYDFTNLATLKDWSMKMVFVDVLWGTFLCGVVALGSYYMSGWL